MAPGQGAQEGGPVEGAGTHLHVHRLHDHAALARPVGLEREYQFLEVTGRAGWRWAWKSGREVYRTALPALVAAMLTAASPAPRPGWRPSISSDSGSCRLDQKTPAVRHSRRRAAVRARLALPDTPPPAPAASAPEPTDPTAPHSRKLSPQNIKMKNCSKEARDKGLKGADRKCFMQHSSVRGRRICAGTPKQKICHAEHLRWLEGRFFVLCRVPAAS